jgi:VWFA-related protein
MQAFGAWRSQGPVVAFLDRMFGPNDYFAALDPRTPVSQLTFGQRTDSIERAVSALWPSAETTQDRQSIPIDGREEFLARCFQDRGSAVVARIFARSRLDLVMSGLNALVDKLRTIREERTEVLLFSDGWVIDGTDKALADNAWHQLSSPGVVNGRLRPGGATEAAGGPSDVQKCNQELGRLANIDFGDEFRRLTDNALRWNIAFYPISPEGLTAGPTGGLRTGTSPWLITGDQQDALFGLAASTNGKAIANLNYIGPALTELANSLSSYYLLGYYTTNPTLDGKYRRIEVKTHADGVKVTARHGYLASPNPVVTTTAVSGPVEAPAEKTALGALSRLEDPEAVLTSGIASGSDVAIVAEVTSKHTSEIANGADVSVTLTGAAGATPLTATSHIDKGATSALVRVPIGSLAGPWQAHVVVGAAGDALSASLSIATPASATALVSDPILYRATPSPRSPLWPSASHRFTRNDRLHLEWTTSGPLDSHIGRLLDSRGQPLAVGVSLTEPPNAPRPTLAGDVSLAPLGPGDYLVELVVGKGGTTERHLVAIRIGT